MSRDRSDYATTVRVSSLTPADKSRKIRVAGRLQTCDLGYSMIVIEDGETPLLTDISLCLTGQTSYPWLRERNTTVVAIGYLDVVDMIVEDDTEAIPTLILHALVITERRDLDLDVWNSAIDAYEQAKSKLRPTSVNNL